jgi:hypothetical protein
VKPRQQRDFNELPIDFLEELFSFFKKCIAPSRMLSGMFCHELVGQ